MWEDGPAILSRVEDITEEEINSTALHMHVLVVVLPTFGLEEQAPTTVYWWLAAAVAAAGIAAQMVLVAATVVVLPVKTDSIAAALEIQPTQVVVVLQLPEAQRVETGVAHKQDQLGKAVTVITEAAAAAAAIMAVAVQATVAAAAVQIMPIPT